MVAAKNRIGKMLLKNNWLPVTHMQLGLLWKMDGDFRKIRRSQRDLKAQVTGSQGKKLSASCQEVIAIPAAN